jgi:hypothetical protein
LDFVPYLINIAASVFLIGTAYSIGRRFGWQGAKAAAFPLLMAFLLPAAPLVMIGMESLLFAAIALAFADAAIQQLVKPADAGIAKLAGWALALTAVRYEGLFLTAVVCLLLLARRKFRGALLVGGVSCLPAVVYAIVSLRFGWYALPNSLMIKHSPLAWNDPASFWNFFARIFLPIPDTLGFSLPRWSSMLAIVLILFFVRIFAGWRPAFWSQPVLSVILFAGVAAIHGMWIAAEWQYRYEAYLMAIGMWALAGLCSGLRWPNLRRTEMAFAALLALILGYAPMKGAILGLLQTPLASRNIFDQQIQMSRFLSANFEGEAVVANDIGAINYFADLHLVDAYGLASLPVAEAKQAGVWEQKRKFVLRDQASLAGADIAVVFDSWFNNGADIPAEWVRVASWTIPNNIVCASDTVTWYATSASSRALLQDRLQTFRRQLPPDILVREFNPT